VLSENTAGAVFSLARIIVVRSFLSGEKKALDLHSLLVWTCVLFEGLRRSILRVPSRVWAIKRLTLNECCGPTRRAHKSDCSS
jgi:hypothetical protein